MAILLVSLASLITFQPVLGNGFVDWDDHLALRENVHFRGLGWPQLRWAWTTLHLGSYQPLGWMVYEAEYAVGGLNPRVYHLVSLLLHAANAVVLYALTVALLVRALPELAARDPARLRMMSALAVVLFAVHPLRTEVVAWATAQTYLPCALLALLAVLAYLQAVDAHRRPSQRLGWLAAAWLAFAGSLLSHAVSIGLPIVLVLLDIYPLRRLGGGPGRWLGPAARRVWWEKMPFVLLSVVFAWAAVRARQAEHGVAAVTTSGLAARIAEACYGICFYPLKTVLPVGITVFYPRPERISLVESPYLPCLLAVVGLTVVLVRLRRRWPALLAAWASYLVILAPNSGIVGIGQVLVADRYSYLATMGGFVLLAAGLGSLRLRSARLVTGAIGAVAVVGLMALSRGQSAVWHDSLALWSHALTHGADGSLTVRCSLAAALAGAGRPQEARAHLEDAARRWPRSPLPPIGLGNVLARQGQGELAVAQFQEALRRDPDNGDARYNLGAVLYQRGRLDEAIATFSEALRRDPEKNQARRNLGAALYQRSRPDEAIAVLSEALRRDPDDNQSRCNLGAALSRLGRLDEAIAAFSEALRRDPDNNQARCNLGAALSQRGRLDEAIAVLSEVLRRDPDHIEGRVNLGFALAGQGRLDEAIAQYHAVLQAHPDHAEVHNNLGQALARQGKLDEAGIAYRAALRIQPDHTEARTGLAEVQARRLQDQTTSRP